MLHLQKKDAPTEVNAPKTQTPIVAKQNLSYRNGILLSNHIIVEFAVLPNSFNDMICKGANIIPVKNKYPDFYSDFVWQAHFIIVIFFCQVFFHQAEKCLLFLSDGV